MNLKEARAELERLIVDANFSRIDIKRVKKAVPKLKAETNEDLVREFVWTNHPSDVLLTCFYEYDLQQVAVAQLEIEKNLNLRGRELASVMLELCGFPKEVKPIGLPQIRENLNEDLEEAKTDGSLSDREIKGICIRMAQEGEKLFRILFLFHCGISRRKAANKEAIEKLRKRYKRGRDTLGRYIGFKDMEKKEGEDDGYLTELMKLIQEDNQLKGYYQKHFQHDRLLTQNHIAVLGMFVIYRNLIVHDWQLNRWQGHKTDAQINLSKMNESTQKAWKGNWDKIVNAVETQPQQPTLPKREMLQNMAVFFQQFLEFLSENQIYPKVIVMISSTQDGYGLHQISADSCDPEEGTLFLNNSGEFISNTEFYYHPPTTGIEPILVRKDELKDWATQTDDVDQKQEA